MKVLLLLVRFFCVGVFAFGKALFLVLRVSLAFWLAVFGLSRPPRERRLL